MSERQAVGRHFLQIPGYVPDRILRAMDFPTIDHRESDFGEIAKMSVRDENYI